MSLIRDLLTRHVEGISLAVGGVDQSLKLEVFTPRKPVDPESIETHGKVIITRKLTGEGGLITLDAKQANTTTFTFIINPNPNPPPLSERDLD